MTDDFILSFNWLTTFAFGLRIRIRISKKVQSQSNVPAFMTRNERLLIVMQTFIKEWFQTLDLTVEYVAQSYSGDTEKHIDYIALRIKYLSANCYKLTDTNYSDGEHKRQRYLSKIAHPPDCLRHSTQIGCFCIFTEIYYSFFAKPYISHTYMCILSLIKGKGQFSRMNLILA